jgi:hypothetical protein
MTENQPAPPPRGLHHKVRHHVSRARQAWKDYYHYKRLDEHGNHIPWHGRKGWTRAILTALVLAAIIAWGFYHTL